MFTILDLYKVAVEAAFIPFFSVLDALSDSYVKECIKNFESNSKA